jgi:hypothetical protein
MANGVPTLVQVKRSSYTRGRREVVAQRRQREDVLQRGADG